MSFPPQTATKVATSSVVAAAVVAVAGLGLLGMAAGLLPGISTGGYVNLKSSVVADKQSIEVEGDLLTYVMTIANTGTSKATNVTVLQRLAADKLSFVSAKATSGITCSASAATSSSVACTGGTIAPGTSATITIVTKLAKNADKCGKTASASSIFSVDPANAIEEKDENDNVATLSMTVTGTCPAVVLPNLTATDIAVAANGLVSATLKNTGNVDVSIPSNVSLHVNGASSMTYSTTTLADVAFLRSGGSSPISTKMVDLATTTSVKICADALGVIAESDETDNCSEKSLVLALPNLTATDIAVAANGLVSATLKNTGAMDVTAPFYVFVYVNGTRIMSYSTANLANVSFMKSGGSWVISPKVVDLATTTSVKICTDALGVIAESSETDNCSEKILATGTTDQGTTSGTGTTNSSKATEGIDLTVKKTALVPTARQGDVVTYVIAVSNIGTVAATSVVVTDVFTDPFAYISATGTNGFVCTLSSRTVTCKDGIISAGSSATITVMGSIGVTGLACDTTKMISDVATVDPLGKIVETNENNNVSTAQTILTNPCSGSSTSTSGGSVTSGSSTVIEEPPNTPGD